MFEVGSDPEDSLAVAQDIVSTETSKITVYNDMDKSTVQKIFYIMPYQIYKIIDRNFYVGRHVTNMLCADAQSTFNTTRVELGKPEIDPLMNRVLISARVVTVPTKKKKKRKSTKTKEPKPKRPNG